jgi:hypothetical protein
MCTDLPSAESRGSQTIIVYLAVLSSLWLTESLSSNSAFSMRLHYSLYLVILLITLPVLSDPTLLIVDVSMKFNKGFFYRGYLSGRPIDRGQVMVLVVGAFHTSL